MDSEFKFQINVDIILTIVLTFLPINISSYKISDYMKNIRQRIALCREKSIC